ncbi:MAG: cyclic 2,3-diphosphoglycerate synthetase [Planctomycetota bacterium]
MSPESTWLSPFVSNLFAGPLQGKALVCLVDGEHYPPVVQNTVEVLESVGARVAALVFIGGTEKVEDATVELAEAAPEAVIYAGSDRFEDAIGQVAKAITDTEAEVVMDLSDEPVVDYARRFRLISRALRERVPYVGADFMFTPPAEEEVLSSPSLAITGTGKRVGKTAVGVSVARLLDREGMDPVVVCMGRGGPPSPEYVNADGMELDADALIGVAEGGGHAASDYWEDALLSQVPTIGCRRCGGGMAGSPMASNVVEGARMAEDSRHDFVVMEGSGATFAPVRTDRRMVIVGAGQPVENVLQYLGEYRIASADLAILTMCERPLAGPDKVERLRKGILQINPEIDLALTIFRPEPLGPIQDRRVFLATTAPEQIVDMIVESLEEEQNCRVTGVSTNLSDRAVLRKELDEGLKDCDTLLTEIKAASIDVAAMAAKDRGADIVFLHNSLVRVGGNVEDLDTAILNLCRRAKGDRQ